MYSSVPSTGGPGGIIGINGIDQTVVANADCAALIDSKMASSVIVMRRAVSAPNRHDLFMVVFP